LLAAANANQPRLTLPPRFSEAPSAAASSRGTVTFQRIVGLDTVLFFESRSSIFISDTLRT